MKPGFVFKYKGTEDSPETKMKVHPEQSLDELLTHIKMFLRACGYPEKGIEEHLGECE